MVPLAKRNTFTGIHKEFQLLHAPHAVHINDESPVTGQKLGIGGQYRLQRGKGHTVSQDSLHIRMDLHIMAVPVTPEDFL